ncbi:MAG: hypothetical protein GX545_00135 [Fibrobacter sp.]|jgi:hypothetical protein|nr:hypothetical protein [Fibrobacter sp.]
MKYHYRIYRTLMESIRLKNEALEKYPSYVTEITVYDDRETGAYDVEFWLSSSDDIDVEINGKLCFVGPSQPILVRTNALGHIYIVGETSTLSFPEFTIRQAEEEETVHIHPSGPIYKKLSSLENDCFLMAKKRGGKPFISPENCKEETLKALCKSIKHLFHFSSSSEMIYPGFKLVNDPQTLKYFEWNEDALSLFKKEIDSKELVQYGKVADFRDAVKNKSILIQEVIFEKKVGFYFLYQSEDLQYIYFIDDFSESSVLDIVEILFCLIGVSFNDLYEWLGFFVDTKKLYETTQKIALETRLQYSLFDSSIETCMKETLRQGISYLWETNKIFTQMINSLDPNLSISETLNASGYIKIKDMGHFEFLSRNFLWQTLINSDVDKNFFLESSILKNDYIEDWDDFLADLKKTVVEIQKTMDFESAMQYFSQLFQRSENFYSYVMSGLLKVMKALSLMSLEKINDDSPMILKHIQKLIIPIESLLEKEVQIPLLSAYYSEISGGKKLTWMDLPAFTAAIPLCALKEKSEEYLEEAFKIIAAHQYFALSVKTNISPLLAIAYKSGFLFPTYAPFAEISDAEKKYRTSIAFDLVLNGIGSLLPMDPELKYQSQITSISVSLATSLYQIKDIASNEASEYLYYLIPQLSSVFMIGYLKELDGSTKAVSRKFPLLADAAAATGLPSCIRSNRTSI